MHLVYQNIMVSFTLYTVHCTVYSVQCTVYIAHTTIYIMYIKADHFIHTISIIIIDNKTKYILFSAFSYYRSWYSLILKKYWSILHNIASYSIYHVISLFIYPRYRFTSHSIVALITSFNSHTVIMTPTWYNGM